MTRPLRFVDPDAFQHVTHRGDDGEIIFRDRADRVDYIALAAYLSLELAIRILAYVLMDNHVHWLLSVKSVMALSLFVQRLDSEHATRMNAKYGKTGHLFGNRFYSGAVDLGAGVEVARYIDLNPVRAGMVALAEDFEFSSARAHVLKTPDRLIGRVWEPLTEIENYGAWLRERVDDIELRNAMIRRAVRTGTPLTKSMLTVDLASTEGQRGG